MTTHNTIRTETPRPALRICELAGCGKPIPQKPNEKKSEPRRYCCRAHSAAANALARRGTKKTASFPKTVGRGRLFAPKGFV